jgi:H+/Cl- antiporter ClcA
MAAWYLAPRRMRFVLATLLTGLGAGVAGTVLVLVLHAVQHVAYGYAIGDTHGVETFLEGSMQAPPLRRLAALAVCGFVAGVGWRALEAFGEPLVSTEAALEQEQPRLPPGSTVADALLQMVTVALGSPLGREVAPRQLASLVAERVARAARLSAEDTRVLLACGAGAGLAAVYKVPFGGALFALEAVLRTTRLRAATAAIVTSGLAASIAWAATGDEPVYRIAEIHVGPALMLWSIANGPLLGAAAYGFLRLTRMATAAAPTGSTRMVASLVAFVAIGAVAMRYPQILGNGKGPAQLGFGDGLTTSLAAILFALKLAATLVAFRAGARGGVLTPSVALGALMSAVLAAAWSFLCPDLGHAPCAVVGATAFLAAAQQMPVTAIALTFEFTRAGTPVLFPMLLAAGGATATAAGLARLADRRGTHS